MRIVERQADVRFGSEADMQRLSFDVRFTPESGHPSAQSKCLLWATRRHATIKRMTSVTAGLKWAAEMGPNSVIRTYKSAKKASYLLRVVLQRTTTSRMAGSPRSIWYAIPTS
jgi:hypothetical protein